METPRTPDHSRRSFARTNPRTILQRAAILRERFPAVRSIAELCGGDCLAQAEAYRRDPGVTRYLAVDIDPAVAARNRDHGIDTILGDALDSAVLQRVTGHDLIFFGPPLSEDCDGHRLLAFDEVRPGFADFVRVLLGDLAYSGTVVLIGPRTTDMGAVRRLHAIVRTIRPDYGLMLIHRSHSRLTGRGEITAPRLKYVELWFSADGGDLWEIVESRDED